MSNKIRGVRNSIPTGYVLGRTGNSSQQNGPKGDVGLIKWSDIATKQYARAFGMPYISDGYILANTSGGTNIPSGVSFTANGGYLDYVFGNPALQGQLIYRDSNANGWKALATSTAGYLLSTNGVGANPTWINVPAAAAIADGDIISNISGGSAVASGNTITATWDHVFGSAQGDLYFRGSSVWKVLAPGAANTILISNGAASDLSYSGLSALIDAVFGSAQGDILYRDTSAWKVLAPGTSGDFLQTQGASANPQWAAAGGGGGGSQAHPGFAAGQYYSAYPDNAAPGTLSLNANNLYACPFYVPTSTTFNTIGIRVASAVAASHIRLGVYNNANGQPSSLLFDAGVVSSAATTLVTIGSLAQTIAAGWYWLVCISDNSPSVYSIPCSSMNSFYGFSDPNTTALGIETSQAYGALPGTFPAVTYARASMPRIVLKK